MKNGADRAVWCLLAAGALASTGCPRGDDDGARLTFDPGLAGLNALAVGAELEVTISDACTSGLLNSCSTDAVERVVTVEAEEAVLEAAAVESQPGVISVRAVGVGSSQLFVTASFGSGAEDDQDLRSADHDFDVAEPEGATMSVVCRTGLSGAGALIASGLAVDVDLALTGKVGGIDRELFLHEVDWGPLLTFSSGTPAINSPDGTIPTTSPTSASLTFAGPGPTTVTYADTENQVGSIVAYEASELTRVGIEVAGSELDVGDSRVLDIQAFVGEEAVCTLPEIPVIIDTIDADICVIAVVNEQGQELPGAARAEGNLSQMFVVQGAGEGDCQITITTGEPNLSEVINVRIVGAEND